jgi:hypothetical protein
MKSHTLLALAITGLATIQAHAAGYISDLTGLNAGDPLVGVDGWGQSHPNDGDAVWAFGSAINGSPAAAVGGYYNTDLPAGASGFHAYQNLSLTSGMAIDIGFALADSIPFDVDGTFYGAERNRFDIGFFNASGDEILSVMFDPNVDFENPDPLTNLFDTWNVSTSSGGVQTSATMAVIEGAFYSMHLLLLPVAGNMNLSYSMTGSNTQSSSRVLTGLGNEAITQMRVGITGTDAGGGNGNQFGTNFIAFNGIAATIPEPSSILLCSITLGGLVLRRRRA